MRQMTVLFALTLLVLTACASSTVSSTPVTNDPEWVQHETYAVYDEVIRSEYGSSTVIVRPTNMQSRIAEGISPDLQSSTARNFNRLNEQLVAIEDLFSDDYDITFLGKSEFEAFFPEGGDRDTQWDAFYEQYAGSGGYLQLSQVAFNDDGTQALVRYILQGRSDMEFCMDEVLLLENQDGEWSSVDVIEDTPC